MLIEFRANCTDELRAAIEVAAIPKPEEIDRVSNEVDEVMEKWSEEHDGDFIDFDFESVCKEACKKHLAAIGNTTITTIYI
jgi:hypothetical protein